MHQGRVRRGGENGFIPSSASVVFRALSSSFTHDWDSDEAKKVSVCSSFTSREGVCFTGTSDTSVREEKERKPTIVTRKTTCRCCIVRGVAKLGVITDEREFGGNGGRSRGHDGSGDGFVNESLALGVHVVGNGVRIVCNVNWRPLGCTDREGVWTPEESFRYLLRIRECSGPTCEYYLIDFRRRIQYSETNSSRRGRHVVNICIHIFPKIPRREVPQSGTLHEGVGPGKGIYL